jgi:hypothetical protein
MAAPTKKHSIAAQPGTSFTRRQVYFLSKQFVYPPCKKQPDDIRPDDDLATDLGYVGNSKRLLAPKTNNTFALEPPHHFTGPEMELLTTVSNHVTATCGKLKDAGRLLP